MKGNGQPPSKDVSLLFYLCPSAVPPMKN
jgi:hypothetical protein